MTPPRALLVASAAAGALVPLPLCAQSFDDLTTFRNPTLPFTQVLQLRAGVLGSVTPDSDPTAGLDGETSWDGSIWFHDESFGNRNGQLEAYAGRDGLVASIMDGRLVGNDTVSRLQLSARLWQFYREGFYRSGNFVPTGRYEGSDWEIYLGFAREAAQDLLIEFGPFYGKKRFERSDDTVSTYTIPDSHAAYGGRAFFEQNTTQLDRRSGMPRQGFIATVVAEREWNDSEATFGPTGFQGELPSAVWRARGKMQWYVPQSDTTTWEIFAAGMLTDQRDRIVDYDAAHPQGNLWIDGQLRLRVPMGDSFTVTPFANVQFTRILHEDQAGSDKKVFFGGGVEAWAHLSNSISLNAWYSYLDNESRPTVRIDKDVHGQHMFFIGMVLDFAGSRR